MAALPATQMPSITPAEMQILVSRAGLVLNPGQVADLVLAWRQLAGLIAAMPRDRPLGDDMALTFRLPAPPAVEPALGPARSRAAPAAAGRKVSPAPQAAGRIVSPAPQAAGRIVSPAPQAAGRGAPPAAKSNAAPTPSTRQPAGKQAPSRQPPAKQPPAKRKAPGVQPEQPVGSRQAAKPTAPTGHAATRRATAKR